MLKVECESCKAPYQVDERRVPPAGLKMRCPKCGFTFLVTDPSKGAGAPSADGALPKAPPKKATMVGVGAFPLGGKSAQDDGLALPAVKQGPARTPGRSTTQGAPAPAPGLGLPRVSAEAAAKPTAPAMPAAKPPPAALPSLDDLDLPALVGDVGLPAPAMRSSPGARPNIAKSAVKPAAAPPPPQNPYSFEIDLPAAAPAGGGGGFGDIGLPSLKGGFGDLPSPKVGGGGFGDLPSPKAGGGGFGDLPSPKVGGGFGDLPSPKVGGGFADLPMVQNDLPVVGGALPSPKAGGFGELDLPSLQNNLPQPMGFNAHLPSPMGSQAHLPSPMGQQAHLPTAMGQQAHLPTAMGQQAHLPSPMGSQAHLPTAMGLQAHLPSIGGSLPAPAGAQSHMPSPVSDDRLLPKPVAFGELDLPLVGTAGGILPANIAPALGPGLPPRPDPVSFGELDLPADPSLSLQAPVVGGPSAMPPPMGNMAFGEVDLGGGGADAPGPLLGPPPAMSAGSFAFQEASLESASMKPPPGGRAQRSVPVDRPSSKAPKIFAALLGLIVVGGAALQFTPVGAFGYIAIGDVLNSGNYVKNAAAKGDEARKKLAVDTFQSATAAADEIADAKKRSPRSRPLAAYAAFVEYMAEVRFGTDATRGARVTTFLTEIPSGTDVPYLAAAQAAQTAATGDWQKAAALVDTAIAKEPKDGIQQDLSILKGELALARRDGATALSAFNQAASSGASARTHFGLARAYFMTKSFTKAKDAVDAALKATPNHAGASTLHAELVWELHHDDLTALKELDVVLDAKARKGLGASEVSTALSTKGWIMFARDRAGDARAAFDEAVKIDPRNVSALVGQGEVLYADGRYTEALTRFEEAVQKDGTSVPAILGGAKTKISLERLADAKTELSAARAKAPKDVGVALWLARVEDALGNKKVAEELYSNAIDLADPQNPDSIQAYAAFARFLATQGRTSEAQTKLDQARSKLPDTAALQRALGDVASAQGQFDEAVAHFEAALQKNPNDLGTRFRLGTTFRKMRKLDQAAKELDNVAAVDKEYPGLALERGLLFEESGDIQKALEQFQSASQKAPNDIDLMLHVGAAYVTVGEVDKALPLLTKVKDQRPNSAEANHFIGRAYLKKGGLESAASMRYLQRAVDLDPNRAEYHLYLAWAANESTSAQFPLARKHVDKALALDKFLADGYWQRGIVERRELLVNDAIKDLKRALELKPSRHEAHATLAECYEDKNDIASAMIEWQKAIVGDDKQPMWRWRYGRLLSDKNQNAEAAKHLVFAVEKGKAAQPRPGWLAGAAFEAGETLRKTGQKKDACEHYHLFMELASPSSADRRDAIKWQSDLGCPWEGR